MLSRRHFLRLAGIVVTAAALPPRLISLPPRFETTYGRVLTALPIYAAPNAESPQIARLWPDTITPILDASGAWLHLPQGFARREGLQPMIAPASHNDSAIKPPFWAEVSGAMAVVRAFCAADAPVIARIGHGGVLRVSELLPTDGLDWYGVSDENDNLIGWSQAADWSPTRTDRAASDLTVRIDPFAQRLTVLDGDQALLSAPISTGQPIPSGVYPISGRRLSLSAEQIGTPWSLRFGEYDLSGVYWHNQFGAPSPGAAVQITPPLAKWLYPRAAMVIVL